MPATLPRTAFYRFRPEFGWLQHVWKGLTRQDHAAWRGVFRDMLPEDGIALDVGAHGGQFTRLLAGMAPRGLVVAVEPSGYARSILRLALWLRRVPNAVVIAAALGAAPGFALLRTPLKRSGAMGYGLAHLGTAGAEARPEAVEPVAVLTLDALVAALDLPRLDLIKADIEGHEAALIAGARETLRRYRPALLLEVMDGGLRRAGSSRAALWAALQALDYAPYRLAEGVLERWTGEAGDGDVIWLPLEGRPG